MSATWLSKKNLNEAVAAIVSRQLRDRLIDKEKGHCAQINDIPEGIMLSACRQLNGLGAGLIEAYVLTNKPREAMNNCEISATKLIERRNVEEKIVVVFSPPNLKTSAEDSYGSATFENISFLHIYRELRKELELRAAELAAATEWAAEYREIVDYLAANWKEAEDSDWCLFYSSMLENGITPETIGVGLAYLKLIPDFRIIGALNIRSRIQENIKAVGKLNKHNKTYEERVQSVAFSDPGMKRALYQLLKSSGSRLRFEEWVTDIAVNPEYAGLRFENWEINEQMRYLNGITITQVTGDALSVSDDSDYPKIAVSGGKTLTIEYDCSPAPPRCEDWAKTEVHLLDATIDRNEDPYPMVETITVFKKPTTNNRSQKKKLTPKQLEKLMGLEGSLYKIGLRALSEDGSVLETAESELTFLIHNLPEETDLDVKQKKVIAGMADAVYIEKMNAMREDSSYTFRENDIEIKKMDSDSLSQHVEFTFTKKSSFALPVNRLLLKYQDKIVDEPDYIGPYVVPAAHQPSAVGVVWEEFMDSQPETNLSFIGDEPVFQAFREFRKQFLREMKGIRARIGQAFIINFEEQYLVEKTETYIEAYLQLIDQLREIGNVEALRQLLLTDTFEFYDKKNDCLFALMTPTHPLRLAWSLGREEILDQATKTLQRTTSVDRPYKEFEKLLMQQGLHYPNIIRLIQGSWMIQADILGGGWCLFIPEHAYGNPNYLDAVYTALGFDRTIKRSVKFDVHSAEQKIARYLLKHPYLSTLVINVFEPGEGEDIVELLRRLLLRFSKDETFGPFRQLRYQLRLISSDNRNVGAAIDRQMEQSQKTIVDEFEQYINSERVGSLFPNFSYSKHTIEEFESHQSLYSANISIVQQVLNARIGEIEPDDYKNHRSNYLGGLQFEYASMTNNQWDQQTTSYWKKFIATSDQWLPTGISKEVDLAHMLQIYSNGFTDAMDGATLPCIYIEIEPKVKKLLYAIHQASEWVIISDELLGVEFLDRPSSGRDRINLIDFTPQKAGNAPQLYVSTDRTAEIETLVKPVCASLGINLAGDAERAIMDSLNSISGRLALKLAQNETSLKGAMGMALGRLYLEEMYADDQINGAEQRMLLIPVDAHDEWFFEELNHTLSLKKTDIVGINGNAKTRELYFHLIEVKWRNHVDTDKLNSTSDLVREITGQLANTEEVLARKFIWEDGLTYGTKPQDLMALLDYYLNRAYRYKNFGSWDYEKLRSLILTLDQGYKIRFVKHGFIFAMNRLGVTHRKADSVHMHIIGRDKVQLYINGAEEVFHTDRYVIKDVEEDEMTLRTELFAIKDESQELAVEKVPAASFLESAVQVEEAVGTSLMEVAATSEAKLCEEAVVAEGLDDGHEISVPEKEQIPVPNAIIGDNSVSAQYGLLGKTMQGETVAVDLNGCHTISLFGVQGSGKSYTLGSMIEMAVKPIPQLNKLPSPLGAVIFHYSKTETYAPEFVTLNQPNDEAVAIRRLEEEYGVSPDKLDDIVMIVPSSQLEQRRNEYPGIEVLPLHFQSSELRVEDWQFLMGTSDNQAMYLQQLKAVFRLYRRDLSLANIRRGIEEEAFDDRAKRLLEQRLRFVEEYINDASPIGQVLKPGRVVIIDLRDEFIEESEALGLFMVLLRVFSNVKHSGNSFNKLIVFDEAHKYMDNSTLMKDVVEVIREMRHKGVSMLIASQNPPSVPTEVIELSNMLIMHKFNTPSWLKHIQKTITAASSLQAVQLNKLKSGEGYVWASRSSYSSFEQELQKLIFRPRVTKHGGNTKKASEDA
ncbi:ATP-binding protein [Paenibacillus lautus]|uniref:ATP-binding protein n=1 Tax=Paenibacillus lautus TaxID=1401 RepID=UPI003D9A2DE9